ASFLLAAGAKGKRYILPNSRVMIHQPSGGAQGQASDIAIQAKEILYLRERLNKELAANTGQPLEKIERDVERDYFMVAEDAREYGYAGVVRPASPAESVQAGLGRPRRPFHACPGPRRGGDGGLPACAILGADPYHPGYQHDRRPPGSFRRQRQDPVLLLLRQEPARGPQADRGPERVHL